MNIVFGAGKLYWTDAGGSEIYIAQTPTLEISVDWSLQRRYKLPAGKSHREVAEIQVTEVHRKVQFVTEDISADAIALWSAGPRLGQLRHAADASTGDAPSVLFPEVCLYPNPGQPWALKSRTNAQRLAFQAEVITPDEGAPWTVS